MAKNKYEDYDATAGNNTDVDGVNIDEGMSPSGVNNAMRAMVSHTAKHFASDTIASATTTDLGSKAAHYLTISGTVTITALGTIKAGTVKFLTFSDALTLTHNATTLILPGAANVTTAAGDSAIVVSEGSGNWRLIDYKRASGSPQWGKGTAVASAATIALGEGAFFHITGTVTITDIDFTNAYDGRWAILEFDGALTLTHNGTTLTLPGARSITTAAGDRALIVQDSSDNVHVLFYQPYIAMAPYITPWVAYTPTFSGFGTATSVSIWSRRVGDTLEIRGVFTSGTVVASEARLTLGFNGTNANVTSDAVKVALLQVAGVAVRSGGAAAVSIYTLIESNVGYITFGIQNTSGAALVKADGNGFLANVTSLSITAQVPISGW